MRTTVTAQTMPEALDKLEIWRDELEAHVKLNPNQRKSSAIIRRYRKTKDPVLLENAILRLEFEIDIIAKKIDMLLLQEELTWTLAG